MASLNRIKRQIGSNEDYMKRLSRFAALSSMMDVLDAFQFKRVESGEATLIACLGIFRKEFKGRSVWDFTQPLGDWLVSLPKEIWEGKEMGYKRLYNDLTGNGL